MLLYVIYPIQLRCLSPLIACYITHYANLVKFWCVVIGLTLWIAVLLVGYWNTDVWQHSLWLLGWDVCKLVWDLSHPVHTPFASVSLFTLHTTPTWLGLLCSCQSYSANCCHELMPIYKLWPAKVAAIYYCPCYLTCPLLLNLTRGMFINQSINLF